MKNEDKGPFFYVLDVTKEGMKISDPVHMKEYECICKDKLREIGIDITEDDYRVQNKGSFNQMEEIFLADEYGRVMSAAWFIEKYIVAEPRLEKIYSPYDMRITRQLTMDEMNQEKFFDALANRYQDADIKRNIKRSGDKSGLLLRMKDIGFDLNEFEGEETEKYRLIFLIYCFERDNGCTIADFFSKPTSENRDNTQFYIKNRNGELMHYLKNRIEMQLPVEGIANYTAAFNLVIDGWQEQFAKLNRMVDEFHEKDTRDDLGMTNNFVTHLHQRDSMYEEEKQGPFRDKILYSFYLKLLTFEAIGIEQDIRDIEEWELRADHIKKDAPYLELYKEDMVTRGNMRLYFEDHINDFCKYLFSVETANKNVKKRYRRLVEKLDGFIDILFCYDKEEGDEEIPVFLLLACLYEYINIGNEKVENSFFRYQTSDIKTLKADFKKGAFAFRKNQCAWISRSYYRYNIMMDRERAAFTAKDTSWMLQKRFLKLMKCRSMIDMIVINNYYMYLLNRQFLPEYEVEADMDVFEQVIKEQAPAYTLVNRKEGNNREIFAAMHGNDKVRDYVVENFMMIINDAEKCQSNQRHTLYIELIDEITGCRTNYSFHIEVWYEKRFMLLGNFHQTYSEAEYEIFDDNGFMKRFGDRY